MADDELVKGVNAILSGLARAGVHELDGLGVLLTAVHHVASSSHDARVRPGAIIVLRDVLGRLEAQVEAEHLDAGGLH